MKPVHVGRALGMVVFLSSLLFASCLSMIPRQSTEAGGDKALVDSWELQYQVNDKGDQEKPREATKTLIEFTNGGQVVFNRMDKEDSNATKSRTGKYSLDKTEISITDDMGNTVKWPYQISGDQLVIFMPEVNKKFYWRRNK